MNFLRTTEFCCFLNPELQKGSNPVGSPLFRNTNYACSLTISEQLFMYIQYVGRTISSCLADISKALGPTWTCLFTKRLLREHPEPKIAAFAYRNVRQRAIRRGFHNARRKGKKNQHFSSEPLESRYMWKARLVCGAFKFLLALTGINVPLCARRVKENFLAWPKMLEGGGKQAVLVVAVEIFFQRVSRELRGTPSCVESPSFLLK